MRKLLKIILIAILIVLFAADAPIGFMPVQLLAGITLAIATKAKELNYED